MINIKRWITAQHYNAESSSKNKGALGLNLMFDVSWKKGILKNDPCVLTVDWLL